MLITQSAMEHFEHPTLAEPSPCCAKPFQSRQQRALARGTPTPGVARRVDVARFAAAAFDIGGERRERDGVFSP
jgi:hypothetical protein